SKTYTLSSDIKSKLMDYSSVASSGYENNILHGYERGLIKGYTDGTFVPNKQLMRSEASTVIRRIIDASVRKPFEMIDDDIARLAAYARDTSGSYQPSLEYKSSQQVQADIDFALGWVDAIYNFDYRTTSASEYRSTLEWYYSPSIGFGGKTADEYLDWLYDFFYGDKVILESYAVSDTFLPYQSSHGDLVVPVTIYYRYQNTLNPEVYDEMNQWYKYDTELKFIRNGEHTEEMNMWPHNYIRFYGYHDLSNSMKVGE
ncbi:MAG: S-layer homology domain-containing protein, partial [Vallitaleaceae bacterium]|nr:S-layer homology domain-containing protein [Vallitaleaceae bacterium]